MKNGEASCVQPSNADPYDASMQLAMQAWTINSIADVLHAVMDADAADGLPLRTVVLHIAKLSRALAEDLSSLRVVP